MYNTVFVGGTFDQLHKGHDVVLSHAFAVGDQVLIGLTTDMFLQKFKPDEGIPEFEIRQSRLNEWLIEHAYDNRSSIVPIDDPYEPAASLDALDAIIVTADNRSRGEEINIRRAKKSLGELVLVEVPLVSAEDHAPISSTRVRKGEIDVTGKLVLPEHARPHLQQPMGPILIGDKIGSSIESHRDDTIITVGDVTTQTILMAGVVPSLAVVDFYVARKPYQSPKALPFETVVRVASGPGFISSEAVAAIKTWSETKAHMALIVDGEEDLLFLPVVQFAPLGSVVYYGQPPLPDSPFQMGLVEVVVTEEVKRQAAEFLKKFTK